MAGAPVLGFKKKDFPGIGLGGRTRADAGRIGERFVPGNMMGRIEEHQGRIEEHGGADSETKRRFQRRVEELLADKKECPMFFGSPAVH